ncbi:hypothetical protein [Methanimicrococcus hongohii]|uniref:hypothetical protein n=1 Tax=Methanimicrococcus hongohii TaxID=3028295 RepID=UPI002931C9CF|nr:hypothetical protein [Methanimicrococcus sp. Hf6]
MHCSRVCAADQVCASACICSFLRNPFAFANVPPLPSGFCCRCCLQVSVAAAAFRFLLPLLPPGFRPAAAAARRRANRTNFKNKIKWQTNFKNKIKRNTNF